MAGLSLEGGEPPDRSYGRNEEAEVWGVLETGTVIEIRPGDN